jgi:hypothetical protein
MVLQQIVDNTKGKVDFVYTASAWLSNGRWSLADEQA